MIILGKILCLNENIIFLEIIISTFFSCSLSGEYGLLLDLVAVVL